MTGFEKPQLAHCKNNFCMEKKAIFFPHMAVTFVLLTL